MFNPARLIYLLIAAALLMLPSPSFSVEIQGLRTSAKVIK
jgi:hypothetical protein